MERDNRAEVRARPGEFENRPTPEAKSDGRDPVGVEGDSRLPPQLLKGLRHPGAHQGAVPAKGSGRLPGFLLVRRSDTGAVKIDHHDHIVVPGDFHRLFKRGARRTHPVRNHEHPGTGVILVGVPDDRAFQSRTVQFVGDRANGHRPEVAGIVGQKSGREQGEKNKYHEHRLLDGFEVS